MIKLNCSLLLEISNFQGIWLNGEAIKPKRNN